MAEPVVRDPEVPLATPPGVSAARGRGPRRTGATPGTARTATVDLDGLRAALLAELHRHHPQADLGGVERAFDLAVEAHASQVRASGEPYVTHPIASAQILADLGID